MQPVFLQDMVMSRLSCFVSLSLPVPGPNSFDHFGCRWQHTDQVQGPGVAKWKMKEVVTVAVAQVVRSNHALVVKYVCKHQHTLISIMYTIPMKMMRLASLSWSRSHVDEAHFLWMMVAPEKGLDCQVFKLSWHTWRALVLNITCQEWSKMVKLCQLCLWTIDAFQIIVDSGQCSGEWLIANADEEELVNSG